MIFDGKENPRATIWPQPFYLIDISIEEQFAKSLRVTKVHVWAY